MKSSPPKKVFYIHRNWRLERSAENPRTIIVSGHGKQIAYEFGEFMHRFVEDLVVQLEEQSKPLPDATMELVNLVADSDMYSRLPLGLQEVMWSAATLLEQSKDIFDQREGAALKKLAIKMASEPQWVIDLRKEAMLSAMKDNFWLTRDQVLTLIGSQEPHRYVQSVTRMSVDMIEELLTKNVDPSIPLINIERPWVFTGYSLRDTPDR